MNRSIRFLGIVVLIISASALRVFSQQKLTNVSAGVQTKIAQSKTDIADIRTEYSRINGLPLKPEAFKFESSGCVEGGLITYMKSDGNILKITNAGSIGDGNWTTEFYFRSGKLIFYFDKLTGGALRRK